MCGHGIMVGYTLGSPFFAILITTRFDCGIERS